jgi:FMN phosphatase YigB (HAD superfamily)
LHAAQSLFHDIRPASELGISAVWVDRKGERLGEDLRPVRIVKGLKELADWLGVR